MEHVLKFLQKDTVWMILDELSHGAKTPTQLASKFDMSVANVDNFLSRLVEYGVVKKGKKIRKGRGRPFTEYELADGPVFVLIPSRGKRYALEKDVVDSMTEFVKKHKGDKV